MSDRCGFSEALLHAWSDGEAGEQAEMVSDHVAQCAICAHKVRAATRTGKMLRSVIAQQLGTVEPLEAMVEIRSRIDVGEPELALDGSESKVSISQGIFILVVGVGLGAAIASIYWLAQN